MANSDVDSWYEWKQNDFTELSNKSSSDIGKDNQLINLNHLEDLAYLPIDGLIQPRTTSDFQSSLDVRFVNPAIYVESYENETKDIGDPSESNDNSKENIKKLVSNEDRSSDSDNLNEVNKSLSKLSVKDELPISTSLPFVDHGSTPATYRCYSSSSPALPSSESISNSSTARVTSSLRPIIERRCKVIDISETDSKDDVYSVGQNEFEVQRHHPNGHRVVQASSSSSSCTSIPKHGINGNELTRKIAHSDWIRKKQQAIQQRKEKEELAEKRRQAEAEELARKKEERESRERENFMRWVERKKKEEEEKKAAVEKELALQKRLKDIENKTAIAKALCLRQWSLRKQEEQKARQKRIELKRKVVDEERKSRVEESVKAYEKWRESSKSKSKPATQGLLPHQNAKPTYVNPIPWQNIVDDNPSGLQEGLN